MATTAMNQHAEIKKATKDLVDSLLELNTNNRDLKKTVVDKYATDIKAGNWKLTNQGIGVTRSGCLADGQHRLHAIRKCGYPPVQLLIVYGLDDDVQMTIDSHAKRTARDALHFAFGHRVSKSAPAIGNVLIRHSCKSWSGVGFTNHQLMAIIQEYSSEIDSVVNWPKSSGFFAAPYLAAFVYSMKLRPDREADILDFMRRVEAGEMLDRTMPEFHLRNLICTGATCRTGSAMQRERFLKALKSLEASLNGFPMGVLKI
jgi:hypothetical protein